MTAADFVKTLLATLGTLAVLLLLMRALGKQFFTTLTSQLDRKHEILQRRLRS